MIRNLALTLFVLFSACSKTRDNHAQQDQTSTKQGENGQLAAVSPKAQPSLIRHEQQLEHPTKSEDIQRLPQTPDLKGQFNKITNLLGDLANLKGRDRELPAWVQQCSKIMDHYTLLGLDADDVVSLAMLIDKEPRITYAQLNKNAERYAGNPWRFTGRILEITEINNPAVTVARISNDYYGNNPMWVVGKFHTDYVQGDTVDVIGYLAGSYSYESQAKWKITIPSMVAIGLMKPLSISKAIAYAKKTKLPDDGVGPTQIMAFLQQAQA